MRVLEIFVILLVAIVAVGAETVPPSKCCIPSERFYVPLMVKYFSSVVLDFCELTVDADTRIENYADLVRVNNANGTFICFNSQVYHLFGNTSDLLKIRTDVPVHLNFPLRKIERDEKVGLQYVL